MISKFLTLRSLSNRKTVENNILGSVNMFHCELNKNALSIEKSCAYCISVRSRRPTVNLAKSVSVSVVGVRNCWQRGKGRKEGDVPC